MPLSEAMSYGECIEGLDELQGSMEHLPSGDKRAAIRQAISNLTDLAIKADVQGQHRDVYVERMNKIFNQLKNK